MRVDEEGEVLDNVRKRKKKTRAKYSTPTKTSPVDLKCAIPGEQHTPFLTKRAQRRTFGDKTKNIPSPEVESQKDTEETENVKESEPTQIRDR